VIRESPRESATLRFGISGSYQAAFLNGVGWNAVNGAIVLWLLFRRHSRMAYA